MVETRESREAAIGVLEGIASVGPTAQDSRVKRVFEQIPTR
jgi:hypothetical protein